MKQLFSFDSARILAVSKHVTLAAIGASALVFGSANASAQLPPPQQQVDFGDLDLTKAHDTQRLYRRLRTAALEVCSDFKKYDNNVRMRARHRECVDNALANAIETIGNPSLNALHAAKSDMKLAQRKVADASSQS